MLRGLLTRIASRFPALRTPLERLRASVRGRGALARDLAACRDEIEALRNRYSRTPAGGFVPDVRGPALTPEEQGIVDRFSDLYYRLGQQGRCTYVSSWLGYPTLKCPLDLWIYQELLCRLRPEVILETGTASGGSALFLASVCDLIGHGDVLTIDIDAREGERRPAHPRLAYLVGSSTDPAVVRDVRRRLRGRRCGVVILDSDHRRDHVLAELRIYSEFVPVGGYLIVEDTNINGHPSYPEFGPGPMEAVEAFLRETDAFQADPACERFLLTMNPRGFLRRRR